MSAGTPEADEVTESGGRVERGPAAESGGRVERGPAAEAFEHCIASGGVVLFPSDTVYGLACDPDNAAAIARLYELKRRPPAKASAVMFFDLTAALRSLTPILGPGIDPVDETGAAAQGTRAQEHAATASNPRTRTAINSLMPGGVTALLRNPAHLWPLACGEDPGTLGVRVVDVPALAGVRAGVMQSSANLSGCPEARRLEDVPDEIRSGVDLEVDGGELPGTASTVVDLRGYERDGSWSVLRLGAVDGEELAPALAGRFHFHPSTYVDMLRADIPEYDLLQDQLVCSSGEAAASILDLGTGMGETAARLLARHPEARLVGIDEDAAMLAAARERLGPEAELHVGLLQDAIPEGPFDLITSALCVHHLDGSEKADLFRRLRDRVSPGGRFVLADVVVPQDPEDAVTGLSEGYDKPSTVAEQLQWLSEAGFEPRVAWSERDLVVLVAEAPR